MSDITSPGVSGSPGASQGPLPSWKSSQLTLQMMSGVRARNPFMLQSRELPDAVSPPAWVSELKPAVRRHTSRTHPMGRRSQRSGDLPGQQEPRTVSVRELDPQAWGERPYQCLPLGPPPALGVTLGGTWPGKTPRFLCPDGNRLYRLKRVPSSS